MLQTPGNKKHSYLDIVIEILVFDVIAATNDKHNGVLEWHLVPRDGRTGKQ